MPRYLLSVFTELEPSRFGAYTSKEEALAAFARTGEFNAMLEREGHLVHADGLAKPSTAVTVDARAGAARQTPGPYLQCSEQLGGFWVIEAKDSEQARELAAQGSTACGNVVEVRPFQTEEGIAEMLAD